MGQYFKCYNIDKKEMISNRGVNPDFGVQKLMEQCGFEHSPSTALWLLLANSNGRGGGDAKEHPMVGRWAGDRIVVQGDYAEPGDPGFLTEEEIEGFKDISARVKSMLDKEFKE